jgi:cell division protein FtsZ
MENIPADTAGTVSGEVLPAQPRVKIIGVGDAGSNIVGHLRLKPFPSASRAVVNTDLAALAASPVAEKVHIGKSLTRGQGVGRDISRGRDAAMEDSGKLSALVEGADLVFIVAAAGGGTGGGAAPVLAKHAAEAGAMVVGFAVMPSSIEGAQHVKQAWETAEQLRGSVEVFIPVQNDFFEQTDEGAASGEKALALADEFVERGVNAFCAMLFKPSLLKIDMSTLRNVFPLRDGRAFLALGRGSGPDAPKQALAQMLIPPPEHKSGGQHSADSLVVSIQSGSRLAPAVTRGIVDALTQKFGGAKILSAVTTDETLGDSVEFCVIGTSGGICQRAPVKPAPHPEGSNPSPDRKEVRQATPTRVTQREISFEEQMEKKEIFFGKTKSAKIHGQIVDEPTWKRHGIDIPF